MTAVTMEWESRLGRRLRVRDLYILSTVMKSGSMGKAARQLAMSQPAVSEAIANLKASWASDFSIVTREASNQQSTPKRYSSAVWRYLMS